MCRRRSRSFQTSPPGQLPGTAGALGLDDPAGVEQRLRAPAARLRERRVVEHERAPLGILRSRRVLRSLGILRSRRRRLRVLALRVLALRILRRLCLRPEVPVRRRQREQDDHQDHEDHGQQGQSQTHRGVPGRQRVLELLLQAHLLVGTAGTERSGRGLYQATDAAHQVQPAERPGDDPAHVAAPQVQPGQHTEADRDEDRHHRGGDRGRPGDGDDHVAAFLAGHDPPGHVDDPAGHRDTDDRVDHQHQHHQEKQC